MNSISRLSRFRLQTMFVALTVTCVLVWWVVGRPREQARLQTAAGQRLIHDRDRTYLDFVFSQNVRDHLVTVLGDSRLTHWDRVTWIACPDREIMVCYGLDEALLVWNRHDGSIRRGFYDVRGAAYAHTVNRVFMVSPDGDVQSWSPSDAAPRAEPVKIPQADSLRLDCSPDGGYLLCRGKAAAGPFATVWNRSTGEQVFTTSEKFSAAVFSPDSATVLLITLDTIFEFNTSTGNLESQAAIPACDDGSRAAVYAAAFDESGERLYVGDASGRVRVYQGDPKSVLQELPSAFSTVNDLAVDENRRGIFVAAGELRRHFEWGSGDRIRTAVVVNKPASAVYGGPNGTVACILDGRLVEMNGENQRRMEGGPRVDATCFAFSPGGGRIALAGRDGQIMIRETTAWKRVQSWRAHDGWIRRLVWSPRGDLLISTADDNVLAVWDSDTGDEIYASGTMSAFHESEPVFDFRGKRFARFEIAGVSLVDAATFEVVGQIPRQSLAVRGAFLFSQDGSRLYAGGSQALVNVWSFKNEKATASFGGRSVDSVKLALDPEEEVIFAADSKNVAAFLTATGKPLWSVAPFDRFITDLAVHPSRPLLAVSGGDGAVVLVATDQGRVLKRLRLAPRRGDILQVGFSPDGQLLAAAMSNGAVVVMRTP